MGFFDIPGTRSVLWPTIVGSDIYIFFNLTGKQKMMTLLRFSKFGQIGKKTRKGQRKSLFKELVVGKFTVARVTAKKTLDQVKH